MDDKLKKELPEGAELSDDALDQVAGGVITIPTDRFYDPGPPEPDPIPEPPLYPSLPGGDLFDP